MTTTLENVYQAALALGEQDRIELADRLLSTVPPEGASQLHPAWKGELAKRAAQLDSGEVKPIPWSEVKRRAWESIRAQAPAANG